MEEGAQQLGQLSHSQNPAASGTGTLLLISGSGRGEGAQLLASQPDCMGFAMQVTTEWKRGHIWDILATVQSHSLGTGDKCTPFVSEICLEKYSSVLSSVTRLQGI